MLQINRNFTFNNVFIKHIQLSNSYPKAIELYNKLNDFIDNDGPMDEELLIVINKVFLFLLDSINIRIDLTCKDKDKYKQFTAEYCLEHINRMCISTERLTHIDHIAIETLLLLSHIDDDIYFKETPFGYMNDGSNDCYLGQ